MFEHEHVVIGLTTSGWPSSQNDHPHLVRRLDEERILCTDEHDDKGEQVQGGGV